IGRSATKLATVVLGLVVKKFAPGVVERITVALDDSPTRRYGKHVEGAGVHHDPTSGPAGGEWLFGHNWVALVWLATHPLWGVIAFPLRSLLYVRKVDVPKLADKYGWEFRTKHELGVELLTWLITALRQLGVRTTVWLTVDGAYAARPFLLPVLKLGIIVVSRLRKDACLFDLPPEGSHGNRIYGKNRISLAKRAGHRQGWQTITYVSRGGEVTRQYKTFLATTRLISGRIRVVIVRFEDGGWAPYFCTDESAEVRDILETAAARWAIEEHFHDVKEVWGAGQQQVRNVWSNIGCWHLNQWMYTLVELTSWDVPKSDFTDRSDRPWDNADRRPSHADRRRRISREMLGEKFLAALPDGPIHQKLWTLFQGLIALAT
ncbi:MAG TPA: transposase, partial [Terriglobales bacterium]|nr:transposase [Terriglobales bacterium]